jgi:hypothetical protein
MASDRRWEVLWYISIRAKLWDSSNHETLLHLADLVHDLTPRAASSTFRKLDLLAQILNSNLNLKEWLGRAGS